MKNNKSNRLNVPQQTDIPSDSTTIAETDDTTNNPKVARSVSQLFHGTRKWGSFSKSTINKKKNSILGGIDASSINIASLSTEEYNNHNGFRHFLNFLPILHPVGPLRCSWDAIVMIMLVYTSIEIPYTLAFEIDLTLDDTFGIIAFSIDLILCIDIIFNFRTAYFDKFDTLKLIINPTIIAKKYLRGWFAIDLVTSIPLEFIIPLANNVTTYVKILRVFRLVRVVKILRLLKILKLFDGVMKRIIVREMLIGVRLLKIIAFMLLTTHFSACLWYFVGCETQKHGGPSWLSEHTDLVHGCGANDALALSPMFARYSYAWYWSVVTLFTTGYGDITATNIYEQWVSSLSILMGTCFFAYFIGTLTTLISEGDRISSEIMSKMEEAQHFCDKKKLPREMARAVLTHTRYHCNYNCILDEQSVLANLPPYLQMDISLYISKTLMLSNIDFFNESILDPVVRGAIAIRMRSISCNNGYRLFNKGDLAKEIYVQRTGQAIHLIETKRGKKKKMKLTRGDLCGEYSLILKKRASTVLCATWCEFYVIETSDIMDVLQQYYGARWEKKWIKMKKSVKKEYAKPKSRWRKKRHVALARITTPSSYYSPQKSVSKGEQGMHTAWGIGNAPRTLRSTIRAEGAMFQNIFNDHDDMNQLNDSMFMSKYSDITSHDTIVDDKLDDITSNDSNYELDANDTTHGAMLVSPTTHSMHADLAQLDNITALKDARGTSHSLTEPVPRSSSIDHIRAGQSIKSRTDVIGKAQSFDNSQRFGDPGGSKSARKWLPSSITDTPQQHSAEPPKIKKGTTRSHLSKIRTINSNAKTTPKKKNKKKKKNKSVWFGSMRQNSELRDQAVVAADTMNFDIFREMFADYASGSDSEGERQEHVRAKSEHLNANKQTNDLDIVHASEPNLSFDLAKKRSRSLDERRIKQKKDVVEMTKHNEPPDIVPNKMKFINEDDDVVLRRNESVDSDNTDSVSVGDEEESSSSNTMSMKSPQILPHTQLSQHKTQTKTSTTKVGGGKFGGRVKHKRVVKKRHSAMYSGSVETLAVKAQTSANSYETVHQMDEKEKNDDDDDDDERYLPTTSISGFVTLSQMEADLLINKSFCLTTSPKTGTDKEIEEEKHQDDVEINEEEQYTNRQITAVFKDDDNGNNNVANKAKYVDD